MNCLFKAKSTHYDSKKSMYVNGTIEYVINLNNVIHFTEIKSAKKEEGMGAIFVLTTVTDHGPHPLKVTSSFLEKQAQYAND